VQQRGSSTSQKPSAQKAGKCGETGTSRRALVAKDPLSIQEIVAACL
jgi:hypothetical protein